MRLELKSDHIHGNAAKVLLDGKDISACTQRVVIDASCDDAITATIYSIATDEATEVVVPDVDVEAAEIKVVERAYQVRHPNKNLEETPLRKLLSEVEVEA